MIFKQLKKRFAWADERGVEALEYIGMAAVVVALLGAVVLYIATEGGQQVTRAVTGTIRNMIISFEDGGEKLR